MDMTAPSAIVLILVLAFLGYCVFKGHRKGFLRTALTTFSFVIIIALSSVLASPLSQLIESTKIGDSIENSVSGYIESEIEEFTGSSSAEIDQEEESSFLSGLALPSFIQKQLINSNTIEEYVQLQVESFEEYASAKVTEIVLNAVSYLMVMIIAAVLIKIILKLSRFINKIPIIGGFNKFLGALLGFFQGLLVLWVIGLVILAFSSTSFGSSAAALIQSNTILNYIFDNNLLVVILAMLF